MTLPHERKPAAKALRRTLSDFFHQSRKWWSCKPAAPLLPPVGMEALLLGHSDNLWGVMLTLTVCEQKRVLRSCKAMGDMVKLHFWNSVSWHEIVKDITEHPNVTLPNQPSPMGHSKLLWISLVTMFEVGHISWGLKLDTPWPHGSIEHMGASSNPGHTALKFEGWNKTQKGQGPWNQVEIHLKKLIFVIIIIPSAYWNRSWGPRSLSSGSHETTRSRCNTNSLIFLGSRWTCKACVTLGATHGQQATRYPRPWLNPRVIDSIQHPLPLVIGKVSHMAQTPPRIAQDVAAKADCWKIIGTFCQEHLITPWNCMEHGTWKTQPQCGFVWKYGTQRSNGHIKIFPTKIASWVYPIFREHQVSFPSSLCGSICAR